jgi:predicted ribosomally synthesized peptide with nif11-like leader
MAQSGRASIENIANFFELVRRDSGLQGELLSEVAISAPELLAKVAGEHGYTFQAEDLRQLLKDRELRSMQGEVFWTQVFGRIPIGRANGEPFVKISGPSWVKQAPYRKEFSLTSEETVTSLSDLYQEIESEAS